MPALGMAAAKTEGWDAESASRMVRLREFMGYEQSAAFAAFLGMSPQRWNNLENGFPVSKAVAFLLVRKVPGLTTDWVWFGKVEGLPVQLARELAPESTGNLSTTPSP